MTVQFYYTRRSCRTLLPNCTTEAKIFERELHTFNRRRARFPAKQGEIPAVEKRDLELSSVRISTATDGT
jgi:hypothetical protein